jgi:hypothetical protein
MFTNRNNARPVSQKKKKIEVCRIRQFNRTRRNCLFLVWKQPLKFNPLLPEKENKPW